MFAHVRTRAVDFGRQQVPSLQWIAGLATALSIILLLQACSPLPPSLLTGPDPADPRTPVRATAYRSTVGPYTSQRPVEPVPWPEQNERVTPPPKP
jgi:hypothetical protein